MRGSLFAGLLLVVGCAADPGARAEWSLSCSTVENDLLYEYEVVAFSTGDIWTSCSVSDFYVEAGEAWYWFEDQVGAATARCSVTLDSSGGATAGWWEFAATTGGTSATYNDSGDVNDNYTLNFADSDCVYAEP
jgi:hypothetical protein